MTNTINQQYQKSLNDILRYGKQITTRNSDVLRVRNQMMTFTQTPLVSARKTAWKSALREIWF